MSRSDTNSCRKIYHEFFKSSVADSLAEEDIYHSRLERVTSVQMSYYTETDLFCIST
jgi:hypothetical protein